MKCYLDLWRRAFDFKGISTLREFWVPFGIHAALVVAMVVLFFVGAQVTFIAVIVLAAFHIISAVPFAALTVRRLHDVGKSGWWYFLWYGLGIGAVILMIILACTGCGFSPVDNNQVGVYGPPEWFGVTAEPNEETVEETHTEDESSSTDSEQESTEPPTTELPASAEPEKEFDPAENIEVDVYGPPEWFGVTVEPSEETVEENHTENESSPTDREQETTRQPATETPATEPPVSVEPETDFDPSDNLIEDVYGPPEWFGDTSESNEITGEEDTDEDSGGFDPDDNFDESVYGPPEWFGDTSESNEITGEDDTDEDLGGFDPEDNIDESVYGPPEWFE